MFDIGGWELLLVAAIALIVVGPKDLPVLIRNVGRWVSRARQMAREFQQGMEDAAKEADVDDLRQIGSLKSDMEREVRDFGRRATSVMDEEEETAPRRAAPRAPKAPERDRPAAAAEPDLEREDREQRSRGSGYASRPPAARQEPARPRDDNRDRDRGRSYGPSYDDERAADPDDPLDRFQRGMRRGE